MELGFWSRWPAGRRFDPARMTNSRSIEMDGQDWLTASRSPRWAASAGLGHVGLIWWPGRWWLGREPVQGISPCWAVHTHVGQNKSSSRLELKVE